MSLQQFHQLPPAAHDEAIDPEYDEVADVEYNQDADSDYDESRQGEFADDFTDLESEEGSQEYYARKQK